MSLNREENTSNRRKESRITTDPTDLHLEKTGLHSSSLWPINIAGNVFFIISQCVCLVRQAT